MTSLGEVLPLLRVEKDYSTKELQDQAIMYQQEPGVLAYKCTLMMLT